MPLPWFPSSLVAAAMRPVLQRLAPFQGAWMRRVERADRWRRRCGLVLPGLGWPGMVHQGWGWYDSLGSISSAAFLAGVALFVFATAMYLLAASAVVTVAREPGAREFAIVATSTLEPVVPSPTTAQEPAPPTLEIRPTLVPRVVLPPDLPAPQRRPQLPPPRPTSSPFPTVVELTAAPPRQVRTPGPTSAALSPTVPPQTAVRLTPAALQTPVPTRVPPVASPSARPGPPPTPSAAPPTAALPILTAVRDDGGAPAVTFQRPATRQPTAAQPTAGRPPVSSP